MSSRDNLRIKTITLVFALLIAGIAGFVTTSLLDRTVQAGTSITPNTHPFNTVGNSSFTIPQNAINITVEVYGGGGGGGGARKGTWGAWGAMGGGGGGGAYSKKNFGNSQTGGTVNVTIGGGGSGGTTSPSDGGDGGSSTASFGGATITAGGGGGGKSGSNSVTSSNGGEPGTAGVASGGDDNRNGNDGLQGNNNTSQCSRGGNGAGPLGGAGSPNGCGQNTAGNPGNNYGGGGGGGWAYNGLGTGASQPGGVGAQGYATLSYDVVHASIEVTSISLPYGAEAGGNQVTIRGSGFTTGQNGGVNFTGISFGGVSATNYTVVNDTTITATVPSYTINNGTKSQWVDVVFNYRDSGNYFNWSTTKTNFYEYVKAAENYTNECRADENSEWTVIPYMNQGATAQCRIVIDGIYEGTVAIHDDYRNTISPELSGTFQSNDGRFNNSTDVLTLTYANTYGAENQVFYYTYTAPSSAVLDSYFEHVEDGGDRNDNGYDLYWPVIILDPDGIVLNLTAEDDVMFGLYAEKGYITPLHEDDAYCVNCSSTFVVSTHGAPYLGKVTLNEDLSNSNDPGGQAGMFTIGGVVKNEIDFSELDGADGFFGYTPRVAATEQNRVRIFGVSSDPAIIDGSIEIEVLESGIIITGPANLARGDTGEYTLEVLYGTSWSGTVVLSDVLGAGVAGGVFVDTTTGAMAGTYDPATQSYHFADDPNDDNIRTFSYTLRNDNLIEPTYSTYQLNLTGVTSEPETSGWAKVNILADKLMFRCGTGYTDCSIGYVGELKDYAITPNGTMIGTATVIDNGGGGSLSNNGAVSWASSSSFVMSYNPGTTGKKFLTATVTDSSANPNMVGRSYNSQTWDSLGDYIYVMANSASITGYQNLSHSQTGDYTLTMNGPFVGTIYLDDLYDDNSDAGGVFSNGGSCTFSLANYDEATNTTTCSFTYTPTSVENDTAVRLVANKAADYNHTVNNIPLIVNVYPALTIESISPDQGSVVGDTRLTITGKGFLPYQNGELISCYNDPDATDCIDVVLDINNEPAICENSVVINSTIIICSTTSHSMGLVDVTVTNELEEDTLADSFNYVDINLALSPDKIKIEISPITISTFGTAKSTPRVATNSEYGYTLTIEMATTEQRLHNSQSNTYINAASGTWNSPAKLGTNTWGYALDGAPEFAGDKFTAVPPYGTNRQVIKTSNTAVTNDATPMVFGAELDLLQRPGVYSGTILYTATVNDY